MSVIHAFAFNPFQENTYVIASNAGNCMIIDPGCFVAVEEKRISDYITTRNFKPIHLLHTHAHLDHVFGTNYIRETYGLSPLFHELEKPVLESVPRVGSMYGVPCDEVLDPEYTLADGMTISMDEMTFEIVLTPGHSPGSVCFINHAEKYLIGGGVLFHESIGRTDVPGGNYDQLIGSINTKLFTLHDDYTVYSGHGPKTTIGHERRYNPFLM